MKSNSHIFLWLQNTFEESNRASYISPPDSITSDSLCQPYLSTKRKKRFKDDTMQQDDASDTPRSPEKRYRHQEQSETLKRIGPNSISDFSFRTKLSPKSQASSPTRPGSPTKDLLFCLRESIPSVVCDQPGEVY